MGSCFSTCFGGDVGGGGSSSSGRAAPPRGPATKKAVQLRQQSNWMATGIVGLRDQGLREFPSALQEAAEAGAAVKVIDCSNNRLAAIPDYIAAFVTLQRLVLASNALVALPSACCRLPQLRNLQLDLNQLEELPEEVGQLSRLERLSLHSNRLAWLPHSIGQLKALQFLTVSHNVLTSLPPELGQCSNLEEVDASGNHISELPPQLGGLTRLKTLQLDNNGVSGVPPELLHGCSALQTLSLHGNPIKPDTLAATDGFEAFEARRRGKYDKAIAGGALLSKRGLDEGVDREVARGGPG